MSTKLYLIISGTIFFLVGMLHLFRLIYHWPVTVGTTVIPQSLSYVGFPAAIGLFAWACRLLARRGRAK